MLIAVQIRYSVEAGVLLLAACVLLGPMVAERLRLPGLVGLIGAGAVLGPHVLGWLRPGGFVATLGAAGLLYLMFVAGLELDLHGFAARRRAAIAFGVATFVIPFTISWVVAHWALDLGVSAASLVGAMWASHTLIAFPEVKASGLDRSPVVDMTLAATVITDVAALVVLGVAASSAALADAPEVAGRLAAGTIDTSSTLPVWAGLGLAVIVCFGVLPGATRWMYANVLLRRTERFVWALAAMATGAIAGQLGGVEGMVGAFLAGIGLNRAIPARSELMERTEFVASALLVPAFLISIGLTIDPRALAEPGTLALAGLFTAIVVVTKLLAALAVGAAFRVGREGVVLMASLSIGQAAATLAIAQVGIAVGLFDRRILSAAVVTVLFTAVISSVGTRWAARRLAPAASPVVGLGDHLIVVAHAESTPVDTCAGVASALVGEDAGVVTPCHVRITDTDPTIRMGVERVAELDRRLMRLGHDTSILRRVAPTVAAGVAHLAEEHGATIVLVTVEAAELSRSLAADSIVSDAPVLVASLLEPAFDRVVLIEPPHGVDADESVTTARSVADRLSRRGDVELVTSALPGPDATGRDVRVGDVVIVPQSTVGRRSRAVVDALAATASTILVVAPTPDSVSAEHGPTLQLLTTPRPATPQAS